MINSKMHPETKPQETSASADVRSGPAALEAAFPQHALSLTSRAMHADDYINNHRAVAPPMHVSTTYRYTDDPDKLTYWGNVDPNAPYDSHVYSRETAPNTTRLEAILTSLLGGPSLSYGSGLAAFHAMLTMLNPRRIAIGGGYHGCHGVIRLMNRLTGVEQLTLAPEDLEKLQAGDVLHVETPLNPTGEARDLEHYASIAKAKGAILTVDATFAPPPLLEPFVFGTDIVMHSGTKYFGGHSDMLCGVLSINPQRKSEGWFEKLFEDRLFLGSVMGSMEGWLGVRSLRTLELRVQRQSSTTDELVAWLASVTGPDPASPLGGLLRRVQHASLQPEAADPNSWLRRQMPRGFGPVFSIYLDSEDHAKRLPGKLHLFHHATSLGGVESLIEWRAMTDPNLDKALLRVSIGIEALEDLKADFVQGFRALIEEDKTRS
ncbi:hypothetical protein ACKVWC_003853 [Pyricularia oryzae]